MPISSIGSQILCKILLQRPNLCTTNLQVELTTDSYWAHASPCTQELYIADDEFATGVLLCMNVLRNSTKVDDTRRYISQFLEPTISTECLRQLRERESTHTTFLRATLYTAWGRPGPPQFMKFFPAQPCHMYCKVVRLDSRVRWSGGLSFRELTVVNARCSQQLCFTTLITMGMTSIGL